jgi:hypothetical protein
VPGEQGYDLLVGPEFDHLAAALDDATVSICAELDARLDARLSEKDWLAISTAIAKATVEGLKRGANEFAAQLDEALPDENEVSWHLDLDCTDLWAERYVTAGPRKP